MIGAVLVGLGVFLIVAGVGGLAVYWEDRTRRRALAEGFDLGVRHCVASLERGCEAPPAKRVFEGRSLDKNMN